jgi:hypothetical protein
VSFALHMRLVLASAALLFSAALLLVARSAAEQSPHGSLAGQFLIASPDMGDKRFERTVILMVEHNARGAFGIVVNRPMGERPLADVLRSLGGNATGIGGMARSSGAGRSSPRWVLLSTRPSIAGPQRSTSTGALR